MNRLVVALRNNGITQADARRLLRGERIMVHTSMGDTEWYRMGDFMVHEYLVYGVDNVYLISTGELLPV